MVWVRSQLLGVRRLVGALAAATQSQLDGPKVLMNLSSVYVNSAAPSARDQSADKAAHSKELTTD